MEFKTCKYYKKSEEQEHCPFSCCCKTECIFTLQGSLDKIKELEKTIYELEEHEQYLQQELDDYSESLKDLEDENTSMLHTIVQIINDKKIINYHDYIDGLENVKYIKARIGF